MVALGLVLIVLGVLGILAGVFVTDVNGTSLQLLGIDITPVTLFLFGVVCGALLIFGYSILKWGTKRGLARRKELRDVNRRNDLLEREEAERRHDQPGTTGTQPPA